MSNLETLRLQREDARRRAVAEAKKHGHQLCTHCNSIANRWIPWGPAFEPAPFCDRCENEQHPDPADTNDDANDAGWTS